MEEPEDVLRPGRKSRGLTKLSFNGRNPLLCFVHPKYFYLFLLGKGRIEAFDYAGKKILEQRLHVQWTEEPKTIDEEQRMAYVNMGGNGNPHISPAVSGAFLSERNEIAVGHEDGLIRFYSIQHGRMGSLVHSKEAGLAATVGLVPVGSDLLIAAGYDLSVQLIELNAKTETVGWMKIRGVGRTEATSIAVGDRSGKNEDAPIVIGCSNGCMAVTSIRDVREQNKSQALFVAHAGRVLGVVSLFDGRCFATVGAEDDTIAVFDRVERGGRCRGRLKLGFSPMVVYSPTQDPNNKYRCGKSTFVVGGKEGQMQIYEVIVKPGVIVELNLLFSMESRTSLALWQGHRAVTSISFCAFDNVIAATTSDGHLHQWLLTAKVVRLLGLHRIDSERLREGGGFTISEKMQTPIDRSRIGAIQLVIDTQEALQKVINPAVRLDEAKRSELVNEVQGLQEYYQNRIDKIDEDSEALRQELVGRLHLKPRASTTTTTARATPSPSLSVVAAPEVGAAAGENEEEVAGGEEDEDEVELLRISSEEKALSFLLEHRDKVDHEVEEMCKTALDSMQSALKKLTSENDVVVQAKAAVERLLGRIQI